MCGIIGYIGKRDAAPIIVSSLGKLEYRGYDSAGVATISNGKISIKKDQGYLDTIEKAHKLSSLPGNIGIGHTRWATHGVPSLVNAHPHTSCDGKIALIHNGIIENYLEIKSDLLKKGHKFVSETDTEVFVHLIEESLRIATSDKRQATSRFEQAFVNSLKQIRGSYAFVAINSSEPDKILVARNRAPLIIGLGKGENFVASDIPAFLSETRRAIILDDGEYAVITKDSVVIRETHSGREIRKKSSNIIWDAAAAEKGGYPFFAIKEINEVPAAVERTLATLPEIAKVAKQIKKFKKVIFIAAGTSYHASLIGKYLLENLCKIPCEAVLASEFSWSLKNIVDKKTLVIAVTQSGETADTLLAVKDAKSRGAKVLAITNVVGSSITREADYNIYTAAGPEIAVIATKTFVTQLIALYALAFYLSGKNPSELKAIPKLQEQTLKITDEAVKQVAEKIKSAGNAYFLGRGISYPMSLEGALKLKEISYIHAEGMPAGELKHGTLSLIENGVPVIFSLTPDSHEKTISNMQEVKARGGFIIAITSENDKQVGEHANVVIRVPDVSSQLAVGSSQFKTANRKPQTANQIFYPLLQIIPLQLLAYYTTIARGLNPDKPRNLAKSVTVE